MKTVKSMKGNGGFTLVELVLVITVLGILAVAALPSFIDISTDAAQASRDGVTGAVRSGISLFRSNDLVQNGPPGVYPTLLDTVDHPDGTVAGPGTLLFGNVLQQGIADDSWTKVDDDTYTFDDGTTTFTYTYVPATGTFTSPTAP